MKVKNGSDPYVMVKAPADFPGKKYHGDRYCYEHHLRFWEKFWIVPSPGEVIHHKNEDKTDNRWENLELKTSSRHSSEHLLEKAALAPEEHGTLKQYRRGCTCSKCRKANTNVVNEYRWKTGRRTKRQSSDVA